MGHKLDIKSTFSTSDGSFPIPVLGFGVWTSSGPTCVRSCLKALDVGYRQIDTAQFYRNEDKVGEAIRESNIPRSEIYITTKIMTPGRDPDATYDKIVESIRKIDGPDGYVDLFLIHDPNSGKQGRKMMWIALEKAKAEGKIRDIGVSNYGIGHIEEMKEYAKIHPPAVNQIELHPWCQQREIVKYCEEKGIIIQAYCPLVRNQKSNDPTLLSISKKHNKSTAQVLLRYCLEKGWIPLPKSDNPGRIEGNADIFDFNLEEKDVGELDKLDQGDKGALVMTVDN